MARAAADAKAAAVVKAEMEALAAFQAEFDRLSITFGGIDERIRQIDEWLPQVEERYNSGEAADEEEALKSEIDALTTERAGLQETMDKEGGAFIKAKKILKDALAAQDARIKAEENAARQAELERQEAEAQKALL